ncbi:TPA: type III secretion system export apparatus subunit SctS [Salmonella enterica subsp. enterica serovar Bredeney]|uniref:Surface presentation of antigens protein SpaQ n=3 Tax=Salmonella enterica TaxID=28901 RepID=A0A5J1T1Y6_SALET|nr:type III secretion system export apparatus subunit SctS [Salmonella enterica]EAA2100261.1 EscS/YscS/HrcS family type III secretion system export apparatus protein [Salmonella enterica subsp. enterica serovar Bredeney]EAA7354154.1 EscS/YscS/HrcS family type III secretion system export apparatus protein [Salmonella enterica subsp. enterica]EAB7892625.1 EscS/YscS/HrcS family type III secretion system export apparatus protein [Salmonella enterica subsp. enterica serovar Newport]EBW5413664.1 EscS
MSDILYIANSALFLVLKLTVIPIFFATVVGLIVGIFQTVMQIQEQTLPFGLKMLAVFFSIFVFIEWYCREMLGFATLALYSAFH